MELLAGGGRGGGRRTFLRSSGLTHAK
jgi:hypothetical protein